MNVDQEQFGKKKTVSYSNSFHKILKDSIKNDMSIVTVTDLYAFEKLVHISTLKVGIKCSEIN